MSNFKAGERVVCVEPTDRLIKGDVYTILCFLHKDGVMLIETRPESPYVCFWTWRFRKLDHQLSEYVCAELIKQVKEEQLILS